MDQIFRDNKIDAQPVMEFDNIETVKRAVEINAGSQLPPSHCRPGDQARHARLSKFEWKGFTRPLAILHRKGRVPTPAMKKFVKTLTGKKSKTHRKLSFSAILLFTEISEDAA